MRGKKLERPPSPEPALPAETTDEHFPMSKEQVHVYVGHAGIRRSHPDYYALQVAFLILIVLNNH